MNQVTDTKERDVSINALTYMSIDLSKHQSPAAVIGLSWLAIVNSLVENEEIKPGSCCFQGSCSHGWSAKSDDLHISEDTGDEESSNPANKEPEV
ncbi:hypothetical protein Leryth_011034 [Lithospermum erythrorhizon]|nr:hypothetical protein Leryth_011034 [Lithospermum erythrorhizon]